MSRPACIWEWRATGRLGAGDKLVKAHSMELSRANSRSVPKIETSLASTTSTSTCTSRGCCKIDQLRRSLNVEMRKS